MTGNKVYAAGVPAGVYMAVSEGRLLGRNPRASSGLGCVRAFAAAKELLVAVGRNLAGKSPRKQRCDPTGPILTFK